VRLKAFNLKQESLFGGVEEFDFNNEQLIQLHHTLFEQSLKTLGDNRNDENVTKDVLRWIRCDDEGSFTFVTCCALAGVNYKKIRHRVEYLIKKWKEESDGIQDQS